MNKQRRQESAAAAEVLELPNDELAEKFIIGSIFHASKENPDLYQHVSETIAPESFYLNKHRLLFEAMGVAYNSGLAITPATVIDALDRAGTRKMVGTFLDLVTDTAYIHNLDTYCKLVGEKYRLRRLYENTVEMQKRILLEDPSEEIVSVAQKGLIKIEESIPQDEGVTPAQIIEESGGLNAFLSPERRPGLMTPWPKFNHVTNGLHGGQLIVLGAKPGIGKTSGAANVAVRAAMNGHRVRFESHEMPPDEILFRITCTLAGVDSQEVRAGRVGAEDRRRLNDASTQLAGLGDLLIINRKPIKTTAGLASYLRKQVSRGKPIDLLVVDYLQKLHGVGKFERREQEVAQVAVGLKEIALDFRIPVLALAQLNVDAKDQFAQTPTMDDFRESKAIGQEADVALILRLNDAEQLYQDSRLVNLYVVKQRNGRIAKIRYYFHAKYTRYEEVPEEFKEAA